MWSELVTPGEWPPLKPDSVASSVRQLEAGDLLEGVRARCSDRPRVALIGAPSDLGVRMNNGRPGASGGPSALRAALSRAGVPFDALTHERLAVDLVDAGDVKVHEPINDRDRARSLVSLHERLEAACAVLHGSGFVTVGLGGGHDLTLPMVAGMASGRRIDPFDGPTGRGGIGGVNIDPHLDVREAPGSGMPFRRLIERGVLAPHRYTTLGVGRLANNAEHVAWLERGCAERLASERGGARVVTLDEARGQGAGSLWRMRTEEALRRAHLLGDGHRPGFVSFDLDAIDASAAPGVSAINPCGLVSAEAIEAAELAGMSPGVVHFDVMELSPPHDENGRTARLASAIIAAFLMGFAQRPGDLVQHADPPSSSGAIA